LDYSIVRDLNLKGHCLSSIITTKIRSWNDFPSCKKRG